MKAKKKQRRSYTWMTKQIFDLKNVCCQPGAEIYCPDKNCVDYGDVIDLEPLEFAVDNTSFVCKRCGCDRVFDLLDRNGDDIICRCFKLVIANRPMNFCVSFRVCARCLFPHYSRIAAIMRKNDCECHSITGWRVFLPSPFNCTEGVYDPPPPDTAFIDTEAKERKHV